MSTDLSALIYKRILGGPHSDKLLHRTTLDLLRPRLTPETDVLDTGVGDGRLTVKLAEAGPRTLYVTDYDRSSVERATEKIGALNGSKPKWLEVISAQLDMMSDFGVLGGRLFGIVNCVSVLMHLPPAPAAAAIRKLAKHIARGGMGVVGVLSSDIAHQLYIPATSRGQGWFYPRLKGLPADATEEHVPPEARILAECYPPDSHYEEACLSTGLRVETHDAIIGDECNGSVYEPFRGQALWKLYALHN